MCTVDHVILAVADLDSATAAYSAVLGRAPSWTGAHPELRTRNVGLALGDVTLELIMRTDAEGPRRPQQFWGIAYGVADCDRVVERLRRTQVAVTAARPGLFPGTRVANLRWERTPTLLIAPALPPPDGGPHAKTAERPGRIPLTLTLPHPGEGTCTLSREQKPGRSARLVGARHAPGAIRSAHNLSRQWWPGSLSRMGEGRGAATFKRRTRSEPMVTRSSVLILKRSARPSGPLARIGSRSISGRRSWPKG